MYFPLTTVILLLQSLTSVHATVSVTCAAPWVSTAVNIVDALPSSEGIIYCSSLLSKYKTTTVTTQKCSGTTTSTSTMGIKATAATPVATSTSTYTMIVYTTTTTTVSQKVTSNIIGTITTPQTITSTIIDYFTSDITSYVTTVADPHYKAKRDAAPANQNAIEARNPPVSSVNICSIVGIASSLLTGFCSCVAPGTTSISTSTVTSGYLCTAVATVTSTTATVTPSASVVQVKKTASSTAVVSTASAIIVGAVISTVQVTATSTVTVDVTASSTIDVVATPTDYYENFADLQGGFYFDDTSFLGEYPNVGNSLSTATTDICLDHCSSTPGCITVAIQITDPGTNYDCYLFGDHYKGYDVRGANNNFHFEIYRLISTVTDDDG